MLFHNIIAFGDSHVGNFSEICKTLAFGPETMFRVSSGSIDGHIKFFTDSGILKKECLWIFCFGEIDIRCHIHKQIHNYNRNIDSVITNLVDSYLLKITQYNNHIAVCGTVPPAKTINNIDKLEHTINSEYNFVGSDDDRKLYTIKLNKYLENKLNEKNIPYIDMYSHYHIDGFLDKNLAADLIHISHKEYINSTIINLLSKKENYELFRSV